jgi:hypothetical protein
MSPLPHEEKLLTALEELNQLSRQVRDAVESRGPARSPEAEALIQKTVDEAIVSLKRIVTQP